jgi:hypothetical protein
MKQHCFILKLLIMEKTVPKQINGSFKVLYQEGDATLDIYFMVICTNLPIGSEVSFQCPDPGPVPAIKLPPTRVTSNPFNAGLISEVPAGFKGFVTVKYTLPYDPPPGWQIELAAFAIIPEDHARYDEGITEDELPQPVVLPKQVSPGSRFILQPLQILNQ